MTTLPSDSISLTERLDAAGNHFRAAFTLRAMARAASVMAPMTVGMLFVAGFFSLPGWMNAGVVVAWCGAMVWVYGRLLHRQIFYRASYAEIARLVEQHSREAKNGAGFDNRLINAVLLMQEMEGSGHPWIPEMLRETRVATEGMLLEQAVPWREPRNAWMVAMGLLVVCAIFVGLSPGTYGHGIAVLLHPTRFVPRVGTVRILTVVPGNDTALAGQSLFFAVTVDSPEHKTVETRLQIHFASGKTAVFPMLPFGTDNSQYYRQGIIAAEDMDYMITAGDTQSERFYVSVLPRIHLMTFGVEAVPPGYTGKAKVLPLHLEGKMATAARGSMEAPLGSEVTVAIGLDAPTKEVLMDVAGGSPVALAAQEDGRTFTGKFLLRETMKYTLRVNDGANRTLQQFPDDGAAGMQSYFMITAIPDSPPTVAVKEPGRDMDAKPGDKVALVAEGTDDYGLGGIRLEVAKNGEKEFKRIENFTIGKAKEGGASRAVTVRRVLELPAGEFKVGDVLRYRFVAMDNRDLAVIDPGMKEQATTGQIFSITLTDTAVATAKTGKLWEELRQKLSTMLDQQIALRKQAGGLVATLAVGTLRTMAMPISEGQKGLRAEMAAVAKDFPFEPSMKLVQKSLQVLSVEDAASAVDRSADILLLSDGRTLTPLATRLRQHQSRVIDVLQTLLAIIAADQGELARVADHEGGDVPSSARDAWKKLAEDLKKFEKEQNTVIEASAELAKKPKDAFNANDEKNLADLAAIEDKWEKFLANRLADMSKIAEQDQANASLLEEMVQMKVELATAKNALDQKAAETATPLEENGLEGAKELTAHIERWLAQQPDRRDWQMEEPVTQNDPAMAELPKQLQDMTGDLMDKEEDLTQQMESLASKYADSLDKGSGWDAADGPISNMSAQGVTGNQMPKDMEIQGRSGEGREGRSSGEMVGSTAEGKEGRRTPTRLTNDAFSNSQVEDKSQLPAGGATGGGKKGGLGGEGLEGPAPAADPAITQRLAGQQAQIRNEAERLALQMHAAHFDNFKLLESNTYLKKSEDALKQNHYQTALFYQEKAVQSLNTAKVLSAGQVHVITDGSAAAGEKIEKRMEAAMNGPLPKGYGEPVKAYFEKLAGEE